MIQYKFKDIWVHLSTSSPPRMHVWMGGKQFKADFKFSKWFSGFLLSFFFKKNVCVCAFDFCFANYLLELVAVQTYAHNDCARRILETVLDVDLVRFITSGINGTVLLSIPSLCTLLLIHIYIYIFRPAYFNDKQLDVFYNFCTDMGMCIFAIFDSTRRSKLQLFLEHQTHLYVQCTYWNHLFNFFRQPAVAISTSTYWDCIKWLQLSLSCLQFTIVGWNCVLFLSQ